MVSNWTSEFETLPLVKEAIIMSSVQPLELELQTLLPCVPIASTSTHVTQIEHIDFLGVDNFCWVCPPYLLNIVNSLKHKLFWTAHMLELKCQRRLRQPKYSKYLILWHGRVQFLREKLRWNDELLVVTLLGVVGIQTPRDGGRYRPCTYFHFLFSNLLFFHFLSFCCVLLTHFAACFREELLLGMNLSTSFP